MAADCDGADVTTVEGLGTEDDLHPVQEAMLDEGGVQCGFCTPGFVVAAAHLLDDNPIPERDRDPGSAVRQHLPLHRIRSDSASLWRPS